MSATARPAFGPGMRPLQCLFQLALFVGIVAPVGHGALGALLLQSRSSVLGTDGEKVDYDEFAGTGLGLTLATAENDESNFASAHTVGNTGFLRVAADAESRRYLAESTAFGASTSQVTFNGPANYAGSSQAVITAQVRMDGSVSGTRSDPRNNYIAHAEGTFSVDGNVELAKGMDINDGVFVGDEGGTFTVFFVVQVGVATEYKLSASADATAWTVDGMTTADADWSHTTQWMGVTSVTQTDGTPITGYTLTDENGTDWTAAAVIPEPGAALVVLLPALLLRRRRW